MNLKEASEEIRLLKHEIDRLKQEVPCPDCLFSPGVQHINTGKWTKAVPDDCSDRTITEETREITCPSCKGTALKYGGK